MKCESCDIETPDLHEFGGKNLCEECYFDANRKAEEQEPHECGRR